MDTNLSITLRQTYKKINGIPMVSRSEHDRIIHGLWWLVHIIFYVYDRVYDWVFSIDSTSREPGNRKIRMIHYGSHHHVHRLEI